MPPQHHAGGSKGKRTKPSLDPRGSLGKGKSHSSSARGKQRGGRGNILVSSGLGKPDKRAGGSFRQGPSAKDSLKKKNRRRRGE